MAFGDDDEAARGRWEFAVAAAASRGRAPGIVSMVGYRALDVPEHVHRGLPSPSLTFVLSLDEGVEATATAEALPAARPHPVLLGGLHVAASHVRQRPGQAGVQLAVHPLAARALFGVPAAELSVTDFDGTAVLGRRVEELRERVAGAATAAGGWRAAFALVTDWCRAQAARRDRDREGSRGGAVVRPEVAHAWRLLARERGRVPVAALAERVGLSARHLTTLFGREVGRSPKTVATLMRFEHATTLMADAARRGGRVDLAAVAARGGYCDQAHLTHEFGRFAGTSPRGWLAEEFRNIQDGGHAGWPELAP
ncbi:helix-turn-helix domain-containing protein [Streptomyces sp. 4N509B]|uniref:helix-turn-helix domain-containing protein n=1 Tax=Streptomyces sp. 4N509B TaxID=3457413 RepID=UPI003FD3FD0B